MPGPGLTGLSFQPAASTDPQEQRAAASALAPSQRALKVLSLHLPKILGSRAIAPASLLGPSGASSAAASGVSPESAVLQSVLRAMSGGQPGPLAPPSPVLPAPSGPLPGSAASAGGGQRDMIDAIVRAITDRAQQVAASRAGETGPTTPSVTFSPPDQLPRVWEDPPPQPPAPPATSPAPAMPLPPEPPVARTAPVVPAEPIRRARPRG